MVIGDPDNGAVNKIVGSDYGCGDVCIDLTGCPNCPVRIKEDVKEVLSGMDSGEYVIFCSCTLEYVDGDITTLIRDLIRVSGSDLFIVSVEMWSSVAYVYFGRILTGEPGPKRLVLKYPPYDDKIKWIDFS